MTKTIDKDLKPELEQYIVQFPDEKEINTTINALRQYVPTKQTRTTQFIQRFMKLINHAKTEVFFMGKAYWLISITLFIIGYFVTMEQALNPIITLIFLAPLPFIIGLLEVFKSREQGLLEIEMACKFSAHEVMLARLLLISLFNLTLNTMLTLAFSPSITGTTLFHVTLLWLTPFTLITAVVLALTLKIRGNIFPLALIPLWGFTVAFVLTDVKWRPFVLEMHLGIHFIFLVVGISFFFIHIRQLINRYSIYEEVGIVEISY